MEIYLDFSQARNETILAAVKSSVGRITNSHKAIIFNISENSTDDRFDYLVIITGYLSNPDEDDIEMMEDIFTYTMNSAYAFRTKVIGKISVRCNETINIGSSDRVVFARKGFKLRYVD